MSLPSGRVFVVVWGGLALVSLAQAVGAPDGLAGVLLGLVVAGCCVGLTPVQAPPVALTGWSLLNGFVLGSLGQLGWHGPADLGWLAALLLAGWLAAVLGRRFRSDAGARR